MKIGAVHIYLNHPRVIIGSSADCDLTLDLAGGAAVASREHVLVAALPQSGLVRVGLWHEIGFGGGHLAYDGPLVLADTAILVRDLEGLSRFGTDLAGPGEHRFTIYVDDPGRANRVDVIVDGGTVPIQLTSVRGIELPPVFSGREHEIDVANELELVLSECDMPFKRLPVGLKIVHENWADRPAHNKFRLRMIARWLRWLAPDIPGDQGTSIARRLEDELLASRSEEADSLAIRLASDTLRAVGVVGP